MISLSPRGVPVNLMGLSASGCTLEGHICISLGQITCLLSPARNNSGADMKVYLASLLRV